MNNQSAFTGGGIPIPILHVAAPANGQVLTHRTQPHPRAIVTWTPLKPDPEPSRPPYSQRIHCFSLFPKLPVELRLEIWDFASPPRVLELRSWGNQAVNGFQPVKYSVTRHHFPIILHVNRESRYEALRHYRKIEIGVSVAIVDPTRDYVPWRNHPNNQTAIRAEIDWSTWDFPLATPYPSQQLYVDFEKDVIYFGPEFKARHLQQFLTATGPGRELADLQHLAFDRKLWVSGDIQYAGHGFEYMRQALYSLSQRPVKTIYIVLDDEWKNLEDRYFYRKHTISQLTPPFTYEFSPEGQKERAKTVQENLKDWMVRFWGGRVVPDVRFGSVRRDGRRMWMFKEGAWEIQKLLGNMSAWATWVPS